MRSPRIRWRLLLVTAGMIAALCVTLWALLLWRSRTTPDQPLFMDNQRQMLVIAHRGGAGLWPENTMYAFTRAVALGVDVLEMDIHATADGVMVVIHDPTVERTTNGTGAISGMTFAELKTLDAGYRWTPDGGATFPLRGQGITIPALSEVIAAFPEVRFNIEPKQAEPSLAAPLCQMLREHQVTERVMVGAFKAVVLDEFRRACPEVATSASTSEVSAFLALSTAGLEGSSNAAHQALQVPEYSAGIRLLTPAFIEAAHRRDLEVHAWTINEKSSMERLLDSGIDGIITDYPDRLIETLNGRRGAPAPGFATQAAER